MNAFPLSTVRYAVAAGLWLVVLAALEGRDSLRLDGRGFRLFWLGSLGFAAFNLLAYVGLEHTRAQDASLLVASNPLLTALALWLMYRQPPKRATLAAMLVALFGVALVITRGQPSQIAHIGSGDLMILAGVAGFAVYTLGARRFPEYSPLRYTALSASFGTLTILVATAIVTATGAEVLPSAADVGAVLPQLLFVIFAGAVVAVLAWNEGIRRLGAANGSLFITLVPVVTFAIAIGQGYRPGIVELSGALITMLALVGANLSTRPARLQPELAHA